MTGPALTAGLELKVEGGAEVLLSLFCNAGIDVDIRFAADDGIGTGVALGERGLVELDVERVLARTVVVPLAMEAMESALGFVRLDKDDPSVEDLAVDRERREDDSDGAGRGLDDIVRSPLYS